MAGAIDPKRMSLPSLGQLKAAQGVVASACMLGLLRAYPSRPFPNRPSAGELVFGFMSGSGLTLLRMPLAVPRGNIVAGSITPYRGNLSQVAAPQALVTLGSDARSWTVTWLSDCLISGTGAATCRDVEVAVHDVDTQCSGWGAPVLATLQPPTMYLPGFFDGTNPTPQLLLAPNAGAFNGKLVVLDGSSCSVRGNVSGTDMVSALELVNINYDFHDDVVLTTAGQASDLHEPTAAHTAARGGHAPLCAAALCSVVPYACLCMHAPIQRAPAGSRFGSLHSVLMNACALHALDAL